MALGTTPNNYIDAGNVIFKKNSKVGNDSDSIFAKKSFLPSWVTRPSAGSGDPATTWAPPGCWRPDFRFLAAADSCSASTAAASARTAARPRQTPVTKQQVVIMIKGGR